MPDASTLDAKYDRMGKHVSNAQLRSEERVANMLSQLRAIERSTTSSGPLRSPAVATHSPATRRATSARALCGGAASTSASAAETTRDGAQGVAGARSRRGEVNDGTLDKPTVEVVMGMRIHRPERPVSCQYSRDFVTGLLSKRNMYGEPPRPLSMDGLREQMETIDKEPAGATARLARGSHEAPDPRGEAARQRERERAAMAQEVAKRGRYTDVEYAYDMGPFARALLDAAERDALGGPLEAMGEDIRKRRKQEKEARRVQRNQMRAKLQEMADLAKIRYRESGREQRDREMREKKLADRQFASQREVAVRSFVRRGRWLIFTNVVALVTQVLQVLELYQAVDPPASSSSSSPSAAALTAASAAPGRNGTATAAAVATSPGAALRPQREEATSNTFAYTLCGISGSCLTLFSLAIIFGTIISLGVQSQRIPVLAKISVYLMYFSGSLQMISFFNLLFAISDLVLRCSATLDWAFASGFGGMSAVYGLLALLQMVLTVFLPGFLLFNIVQNKNTVYSDLKNMCEGTYLRNHIFNALSMQLIVAGAILTYTSLDAWNLALTFTSGLPNGVEALGRLMLYPFFIGLIVGCGAIVNGFWYKLTTGMYARLEDDEATLHRRLEEIRDGARATIVPGKAVRLVALVENAHLVEKRAMILAAPNGAGKIKVLADNRYEMMVEEFQIAPDQSPEERARKADAIDYKLAEVKTKLHEWSGIVNIFEKFYVVSGQVILGLSFTFFLLHITNATFAGNILYALLADVVDAGKSTAASKALYLSRQRALCAEWSPCMADNPPLSCGMCRMSPVQGYPTTLDYMTSTVSFTQGNPFSGDSAVFIVGFASGLGFLGCVLSAAMMRIVVKARWAQSLAVSAASLTIFGMLGMAASALIPAASRAISTMDPMRCGEEDIDGLAGGVQEVPAHCLLVTGANSFYRMAEPGKRVAISCPYLTSIWYLFESLNFLSKNIRLRDPFAWARFEVGIALFYTLFMNVVVVVFTNRDRDSFFRAYLELAAEVQRTSIAASNFFGPTFPLYRNSTVSQTTTKALGLWYYRPEVGDVINYVFMGIQIVGLYYCISSALGWIDEVKAARGMRASITLNATLFACLFPFITYLSMYTVDVTFNIFLLITVVPNTLQFSFGCIYAIGTSILPVTGDLQGRDDPSEEGAARKCIKLLSLLVPLVPLGLLFCASLFAAMIWTDDDTSAGSQSSRAASTGFRACIVGLVLYAFAFALYAARFLARQIGLGIQTFLDKDGGGGSTLRGATNRAIMAQRDAKRTASAKVKSWRTKVLEEQLQADKEEAQIDEELQQEARQEAAKVDDETAKDDEERRV